MGRPRKYPPEFEKQAVELARYSGRPLTQIASELGLAKETLRNWVRQDEADRGVRTNRPSTQEAAEIKELRKEVAELKRANRILKLASAYFAQEADPARRPS